MPEFSAINISLSSFPNSEIPLRPDSLLRIFLSIKKIDSHFEIEEQKIKPFERKGFTVVEWGGSVINENMKENTN